MEEVRKLRVLETSRVARTLGLVVSLLALALLLGCGGDQNGEEGGSQEEGPVLAGVDMPLKEPVYVPQQGAAVALSEDGSRMVQLGTDDELLRGTSSGQPEAVTLTEEIEGSGEDLATEEVAPNDLYVPQPERDQVAVIGTEDLLEIRTFPAGEAPSQVAVDQHAPPDGTNALVLALSTDGSTVTAVELDNYEIVAETRVDRGEEALLAAPPEGAGREFWVAGPGGVALHAGPSLELRAEMQLDAGSLAVDATDPERAYAAGSGRIVAVEQGAEGQLEVSDETSLDEEVQYLAAEGDRLYAATGSRLVMLDSGTLETLDTVEYGNVLEDGSSG